MEAERERRGEMRALLAEMEHVHSLATAGERARLRLVAICEAEVERRRRLAELSESSREEEARRDAAREAARKAAEGERRRRLSILQFEEEEQRRVRQKQQRLAIEAPDPYV